MSNPSKISFSNPTPHQVHALVVDYLCHSCYAGTAAALCRDYPAKQLDADGDETFTEASGLSRNEEEMLKQVLLREEIRTEILSGRVDEAISLLNKHFPSVLAEDLSTTTMKPQDANTKTDPDIKPAINNLEYISSTSIEPVHLILNLRILAFSESCRTVPLHYPADPGNRNSTESSMDTEPNSRNRLDSEQKMSLLIKARKLYALTEMLPSIADRMAYRKELENVGGLLAYEVPEESSISKYLSMERREAVADQINHAILKRTGQPSISSLELITRYASVLWSSANLEGIRPKPGAMLPPVRKHAGAVNIDDTPVPPFDLEIFLDLKS